MRLGYFPAIVTLLAVMFTCIICIVRGNDTIYSLVAIIIVIAVFYIIGSIAKKIIELTLASETNVTMEKIAEIKSETLGAEINKEEEEKVTPNEQ